MRANNYYRAAEFFLHGDPSDPRIDHAYHRATQCFRGATRLFIPAIEVVETPEVDESRVGLLGLSMGGPLAPRAAASEHRLAAR
jgi:cephalosporin-C deacetylase-like acetyl esterase